MDFFKNISVSPAITSPYYFA